MSRRTDGTQLPFFTAESVTKVQFLLILLGTMACLARSNDAADEVVDTDRSDVISSVRCRVRCLSLLQVIEYCFKTTDNACDFLSRVVFIYFILFYSLTKRIK